MSTHNTQALVTAMAASEEEESRRGDGQRMSALSGRQRTFVLELIQRGAHRTAIEDSAVAAGYSRTHGYKLLRDSDVLAAVREESTKKVAGAALLGVAVMVEIASNPLHKDQYRAAKDLAALNGFTAEQRIVVEHIDADSKAQIRQIREMATQLGMDPKQLIEAAGIIDAEFEDVTPKKAAEVDSSDW